MYLGCWVGFLCSCLDSFFCVPAGIKEKACLIALKPVVFICVLFSSCILLLFVRFGWCSTLPNPTLALHHQFSEPGIFTKKQVRQIKELPFFNQSINLLINQSSNQSINVDFNNQIYESNVSEENKWSESKLPTPWCTIRFFICFSFFKFTLNC